MVMFAQNTKKQMEKTAKEKAAREEMRKKVAKEKEVTTLRLMKLREEIAREYGVEVSSISLHICRRGRHGHE